MNIRMNNIKRLVACLALILTGGGNVAGSDPVAAYTFTEEASEQSTLRLGDALEFYPDKDGRLLIEDILRMPDLAFSRPDQLADLPADAVIWSRIRLTNQMDNAVERFFSLYAYMDTVWVYAVKDGKLVDRQMTGGTLKPSEKKLRSSLNYVSFSLDAGDTKTFYFKYAKTGAQTIHGPPFSTLNAVPADTLINFEIENHASQFLYTGMIMLFCLVALFMYGMFKERVFIYFALLMFSFAIYFLKMRGLLDSLLTYQWRNDYISIGQLTVSLVIFSVYLFSSRYIRLSEQMPKYDRFFWVYALFVAVFAHLYRLATGDAAEATRYHNFLLIIFSIVALLPLVLLARKGDQSAKIGLISAGIMFAGAVLSLLDAQGIIPSNSLTRNSLQFGTVIFSGVLFYGLFDKINTIRVAKQRMEELNELKSRFFANISHEFRTPLTLMMGPLKQVADRTDDPENRELLQMAHRNAYRQLQLVNQLLDLSKLDAGKMELRASREDFIPFLKGAAHAYESLARERNIDLTVTCPDGEMPLYFNRDKMEKICYNLLSNAFKFTPPGGHIAVGLQKVNDKAVLTVADTGIGISEERLPNIFDRFFQAGSEKNEVQEGSGIGLTLVHELVQLHGGTIAVKSSPGKGTTFTLEFPLGKNHLHPDDIVDLEHQLSGADTAENWSPPAYLVDAEGTTDTAARAPKNVPHLLVVEDNADVRAFIRLRLQKSFHITEATDGQEGIEKAVERMPDLIISDVMMPKKNGYELCEALKTDLRTSHIPIILLTARAAQEEKLEGLQTGADDYLTKPFDSRELEIRAHNLIRLRQQLRERFAESISLKPSEVATNSVDQTFLEDALRIVEANIGNEQFSIEMLAREIGMSRPNLNRKFRALINQSSNQFIQSVRLQRAADLLRQGAGSVSEIAFRTGFSSTAYFVKCFKDHFGETPGSILKNE